MGAVKSSSCCGGSEKFKTEEGIDDGVRVAQGRKGSGVACCDLTTHEEVAAAAGQDDREISFSRAGVSSTLTERKRGKFLQRFHICLCEAFQGESKFRI